MEPYGHRLPWNNGTLLWPKEAPAENRRKRKRARRVAKAEVAEGLEEFRQDAAVLCGCPDCAGVW